MPRLPTDYKKSIIYKIVNADESLIYVGSTTDFRKRKSQHKRYCIDEKYDQSSIYVYQMIRDNGGWKSFTMIPVKEFVCENKIQLIIEEERIRKELNANLNKIRAYITEDERVEQANINAKTYYKENKEARQEIIKTYYKEHKEEVKEYKKAYYKEHKEEIKEHDKAYREAHKEQAKEYQKAYRAKKKLLK